MKDRKLIVHLIIILTLVLHISCSNEFVQDNFNKRKNNTFPTDTLRVATMPGATSYFVYQGLGMGFDYELARNFASSMELKLSVILVNSADEMFELLRQRKVDIITYNTFETKELKEEFEFIFPQEPSYLTLIQLVSNDAISNVTELNNREVWVKKNSIHHKRLIDLNEEIGGNIIIKLAPDSLSTDDLMNMVVDEKIDFTLAYQHKARLEKRYNSRLDTRIAVGFNQKNGWLIRKNDKVLQDSLIAWQNSKRTQNTIKLLKKTYWNDNPYFAYSSIHIPKGAISPYDQIFKKNAKRINWDWRLIAAVAYAESGFLHTARSRVGASGIMQLMPTTALAFGVNSSQINNPSRNIYAGTEYIKSLNMIYRDIKNREERIKFILASYNSGPAPILDARALAKAYGKNPDIWFDNVEIYVEKLSEPDFYNDPVVKYGRFSGWKETTQYVPYVLDVYHRYLERK